MNNYLQFIYLHSFCCCGDFGHVGWSVVVFLVCPMHLVGCDVMKIESRVFVTDCFFSIIPGLGSFDHKELFRKDSC